MSATTTPHLWAPREDGSPIDPDAERVAKLDDETLVWLMLGMHSPAAAELGGGLMFGAQTETGARMTRWIFTEIAQRWIPSDVFGAALQRSVSDAEDEATS